MAQPLFRLLRRRESGSNRPGTEVSVDPARNMAFNETEDGKNAVEETAQNVTPFNIELVVSRDE